VKVLASNTLDRHLTYVAMTRHREAAELYVGMEEFTNRRGGILVDHGEAPYEHKPANRDSYFVTLEYGDSQQRTIWGVDLASAIDEAEPKIGDRIGLEHKGSETVRLPDGTTAERNVWKVVPIKELAMERLKERLARDASKETTLDYERASSYRAALRFAEARGLHLMNVARTISRDRLAWTVRQKQKLTDLAARFKAVGAALGLISGSDKQSIPNAVKETKPMVAGITTFAKSLEQSVEDKLSADPDLKQQWQDVSTRFHLVYAQPEAAFAAVNVDAMMKDQARATATMAKISAEPETFGALKGKTGIFASRADKQERDTALVNAPALARNLERYLRSRVEAERKHETEERAARHQGFGRHSGAVPEREADPRTDPRRDRPERPSRRSGVRAGRQDGSRRNWKDLPAPSPSVSASERSSGCRRGTPAATPSSPLPAA
jgi:hypothetical protein